MRALSADDVIRIWEAGHAQNPAERALTVLAAAGVGASADECARLTLGQRNAHLLDLRRKLFGAELSAFAVCPECGEALEFSMPAAAIGNGERLPAADFLLESDGYAVRFRLLDSTDLAAAAAARDVDEARRLLAARCILDVRRAGEVVAADLPEPVLGQLAARLAELDPQAETLLALSCPSCACDWQAPLDIAAFCYAEISALARRLLREVHELARAYAWREADILAMSALRRRFYLEQLG
jgi:hypothetical protein